MFLAYLHLCDVKILNYISRDLGDQLSVIIIFNTHYYTFAFFYCDRQFYGRTVRVPIISQR